ncbi:MAG: CDP-diacylglycerol O-phosphatidyltransferase, partial [Sphingomonadales bacterium]|nr:CDP-diacylglycerol O-phosphatidyltransferase [Sphingomonadales bacterium]
PAPSGAGLLLLPIFLWIVTEAEIFRNFYLVAGWTGLIAFLLVSNIATFSWSSIRLKKGYLFGALAGMAAIILTLVTVPWVTLSVAAIAYAASIPFSMIAYARVRRRRAKAAPAMAPQLTPDESADA